MSDLGNSKAPHKVLIHISGMVEQVIAENTLSGRPVNKQTCLLVLDGGDMYDCVSKMKEFFEEVACLCKEKNENQSALKTADTSSLNVQDVENH